ncbi:MAG: zinc ribbon domain-containing protein [Lachnospiraceae bacterium]|nr:zinc ribbon domain-containing protein [Lachnospiraceae bacterium]
MFCPKCGAQLPDGSVFCSACGAQIAQQAAQQVDQAVEQVAAQAAPVAPVAQAAAPVAKPVSFDITKINILGAVLTVFLFFTLFMPFFGEGAPGMFIMKPEGWFMILIVLAAGFFVVTRMDSFFMLASAAGVVLCFLTMLLTAVGVHSATAEAYGFKVSAKCYTPGAGVTFALTLSLAMLFSPIINRLFAKRK